METALVLARSLVHLTDSEAVEENDEGLVELSFRSDRLSLPCCRSIRGSVMVPPSWAPSRDLSTRCGNNGYPQGVNGPEKKFWENPKNFA